jgi:hypothetical protein
VGSGKTYVALAAAKALNRGLTACLVPATLTAQWQATAARLGIPVVVLSHEQISRGKLPVGSHGVVVIDESHHFRNPTTRRYRHLAPWLVDRPALLLSATPIVNRLSDLSHQLLLAIRDNALSPEGILSIRAVLAQGTPSPALGRIVIETDSAIPQRPGKIQGSSSPSALEHQTCAETLNLLDRLRLSRSPRIARLVKGILTRAAGSSPAALHGALRRYRKLLLHARDSLQAGRQMDRKELRRFTAGLTDQLIWWELLPGSHTEVELAVDDLAQVEAAITRLEAATREADGKITRLRERLDDGIPTLVFTTWRDTVHYLRHRLAEFRVAWCTGANAGIGSTRVARGDVLDWFRRPSGNGLGPQHLIVSDVAAEGLDLQRAARVIHYDLPWTPMRLEQREGRSIRLGSEYSCVEVLRFESPSVLEARIKGDAILARKSKLPALAGLGPHGASVWRWRGDLADRFAGSGRRGFARLADPREGLLAGFGLYRRDDPSPLSACVAWLTSDGSWTEAPATLEERLRVAVKQEESAPASSAKTADQWLRLLAPLIRERLALAHGRRWINPRPTPTAGRLLARLQALIVDAARRHQPGRLAGLERLQTFLADGHTAGEEMLIERMAEQSEECLVNALKRVRRSTPIWGEIEARLHGMIVFGPLQLSERALASPECRCSPLPSSISMEL